MNRRGVLVQVVGLCVYGAFAVEVRSDDLAKWRETYAATEKIRAETRSHGEVLIDIAMIPGGDTNVWTALREKIAGAPKWNGEGNPPLEVSKAVAIAKADMRAQYPKCSNLGVSSVTIQLIQGLQDAWHYVVVLGALVTYEEAGLKQGPTAKGNEVVSSNLAVKKSVYVLMDGTVINPRRY